MGDAAGHVGPGRGALRGDEIGDVVQRDDEVRMPLDGSPRRGHPNVEGALGDAALDGDLALHGAREELQRVGQQRRDLGHDLGDIGADGRLTLGVVERQFLGRPVEDSDDPVGIDAHDRGRHAGEHGLRELASLVVDPVGFEQPALLKIEFASSYC